MEKMTAWIIKFRYALLAVFGILVVFSLLAMQTVPVNYDLAEYLPESAMTKRAISVMNEEFGYSGMADVMVEDISISQALQIKEKLKSIEGVKTVTWLDDVTDVTVPENIIEASIRDGFYKERSALFKVQFIENDYSLKTGMAITEIRKALGDTAIIAGSAEDSRYMREVLAEEILKITLIVFPLCVLILMFASASWIEPLIYLAVIGVSIAINMGSNIIFDQISFITKAMAAVLQLAVSLDYSIFLFHRYNEEREAGSDVMAAITIAVKYSLSSISASALTTIAGFLALLFMEYRIGTDLGLVLAKGIVLSFVCVILLMPIFIAILNKLIDKTRHRPFIPSFGGLGKVVVKLRYVILILTLLISIPAFLAEKQNDYLYGDTSGSSSQEVSVQHKQRMQDRFGIYNPVMLLIPNHSIATEAAMANELKSQKNIRDVQALVTLADPQIPRALLPDSVKSQFLSERYSRMIVLINSDGETPESFMAVDEITQVAENYYPGQWLVAGKATSIADIKESVEKDSRQVMFFSILAVGLIVLFTFKSLSIPVLLVSVIQAAIWINMSIPYFEGSSLVYIGYLVVSSLQLGATIDYAILLSNRYMEFRREEKPKNAAILAIKTAGISISVSALILAIAGFTEGVLSKIAAISAIGNLLGRGAALSGMMVLFVLPVLLVLFDKVIMSTTLNTQSLLTHDRKGV